jgi:hypothetical protein
MERQVLVTTHSMTTQGVHLGVIRELMGTLGLATRAGQEHVMHKMLGLLRTEILRDGLPLTGRQLADVMDALRDLEHEAGRIAPMPAAFNDNARLVVDVLAQAWGDSLAPARHLSLPVSSLNR